MSYIKSIIVGVARNKVMACLIPYLKNPLNKGNFIFAISAFIPIMKILNVLGAVMIFMILKIRIINDAINKLFLIS